MLGSNWNWANLVMPLASSWLVLNLAGDLAEVALGMMVPARWTSLRTPFQPHLMPPSQPSSPTA